MKTIIKTIFFSALLVFAIGLHANCQTNGTNGNPKETLVMPPDSIAIVSLKDYGVFFKWLQDNASKSQYDKLTPESVLLAFQEWAIREYNKKKKGGK